MKSILRTLLLMFVAVLASHPFALAQSRCDNAPNYFQPATSGTASAIPSPSGLWFGILSVQAYIQ